MSGGVLTIAGGGTGGHVMPALALADWARRRWPALHVQFIGAERGLEASLLPERGEADVLLLRMHGVQGAGAWQKLRVLLWELPKAVLAILRAWKRQRPDVVVGVGGYASASGVVAGVLARIPVVLYEQNAMPGLVNRLLARVADRIMLGLPGGERVLPSAKCVLTGNIVRPEFMQMRRERHGRPCMLVMGGSQGARFLNTVMPGVCAELARQGVDFSVIHLAGRQEKARAAVVDAYRRAGVDAEVLGFSDKMAALYGRADLVVARSGAMTVSEIAVCGLPALFIPFPAATNDHQYHNARVLVDAGGALVCRQDQASEKYLAQKLKPLLVDPERRRAMAEASRAASVPDAADRQLDVIARYLPAKGDA